MNYWFIKMEIKFDFSIDKLWETITPINIIQELIRTPEFNRLKKISFLGFLNKVFDLKKDFSRYEHSLGVYILGLLVSQRFKLNNSESKILQIACLLHDIGHFPFSHLSEAIYLKYFKIDHHSFTKKILRGEIPNFNEVNRILIDNGINPDLIIEIINGNSENKILNLLFSQPINLDTLDAISRSAYCLGEKYCPPESIIKKLIRQNQDIYINKKNIKDFDLFWRTKNKIYSNYIYNIKNVRKEAMFYISLLIFFKNEKKKKKNNLYYFNLY